MRENRNIILICSEDPRVITNGVTAALNTCLRASIEFSDTIDIYIHNESKFVDFTNNKEHIIDFKSVNLKKYNFVFLSPINIAFRYLFLFKSLKKLPVITFLSDTYSYALFRNFVLGVKFNKLFIKYLLKIPIIYLTEKYVELNSNKVLLQTKRDLDVFNKMYFSNKSIAFPNSPIFKDLKITNINKREGVGWVVSCTEDYFPLTKWFFENVVIKVLIRNSDIKLFIHGKDCHILKSYIELKYPDNKFNIAYTNFISEMSDFYLKTKVVISPIYKGYGLINRTIEAMYHGCIVVGDPGAFNGIVNAKDNVNCFIAHNNDDFVSKIEHAYYSLNLENVSSKAHFMVKSDFDVKNNIKILEKL